MDAPRTVGLLHPGEMGAAVGAQLKLAGQRVLWSSQGRGAATVERAEQAGLEDAGSLGVLLSASSVVFSVIPPAAASELAASLDGFTGLFVDANAIAPGRSREIGELIITAGGRYVDAGIVGGPPKRRGDMRFYVSGPDASEVTQLFAGTAVDARVVSDRIGDASALKLAYAGWTKGSSALLLAMREFAGREGIEAALSCEWAESQPDLAAKLRHAEASRETKGWRWVGEMQEIADALDAANLPDGFHRAAAKIYDGAPRPANQ